VEVAELAEPGLKKARDHVTDAEAPRRIEQLLDKIANGPPSPELLRTSRAIEALEAIGGAEAIALLQTIAHGMPGYRGAIAAADALERLASRRR
jgi:hypothetical protein